MRSPPLQELAALCGVQTSYRDVDHRTRRASPDALLAVLRVLGAPVEGPDDAPEAIRAVLAERSRRMLEPVTVAWDGRLPGMPLRLPARLAGAPAAYRLRPEGAASAGPWQPGEVRVARSAGRSSKIAEAGDGAVEASLVPPRTVTVPFGAHRLEVRVGRRRAETLVLSAPRRMAWDEDRRWGVFLPLYALRTRRTLGVADFGDLRTLLRWVGGIGGGRVATLPLFAAFLDEPFEPSPYAPVSRLFWNELYVDPRPVPELQRSPAARALLESGPAKDELHRIARRRLVDVRGAAAVRRRVLEELARTLFEPGRGDPARMRDYRRFVRDRPRVLDYARFRAAVERHGATWERWPAGDRDGRLPDRAADRATTRYHTYVQWLADEQLRTAAAGTGAGLFLDLPLGVHPGGYDVWREREHFALGANAGAPPDTFFTEGQDWGFPPPHPGMIRESGHRYLRECLQVALGRARSLRIDHVMGLHRLFWVPDGFPAKEGVYVRYPAEELYAVLALEATLAGASVVGEDLGTVPGYVREAMARHGILRTYVLQYEVRPDRDRPVGRVPRGSSASLNTHDMPPFASFWAGTDVDDRLAAGWLDEEEAGRERRARGAQRAALRRLTGRDDRDDVLRGAVRWLGRSDAAEVVVNLEDLWGETEPQNVPGTSRERPNWSRAARHRFERFRRLPGVVRTLADLDRSRRAPGEEGGEAT